MADKIPITAAERLAKAHHYEQVIIYARRTGENGVEWVTTYGINKTHCAAAARIGDAIGRQVVKPLEELLNRAEAAESRFNLAAHLQRQRDFSERTFGPGARTKGVIDHIRKELLEIEANPADIEEWVDVIILAFDGAWRAGWNPDDIIRAIVAKQTKNEARKWPDWRTADPEKAIEHDRAKDAAATETATEKWFIGESVMLKNFKDMEWCPFDDALDRINTHSFLARFDGAPGGPARLAYCVMDEDGNIYALADNSAPDKPLNPEWRLTPEPDQVLVPITGWCSDMTLAPRDTRILIKSDPNEEVFAAHWVKNIETDDEAWLISEAADGSQHLCKAKAWRLIPADTEANNENA